MNRVSRLITLAALVGATVTGCTSPAPAPAPTTQAQATDRERAAAQEQTPASATLAADAGQQIADGLTTPAGTVLLAPAEQIADGDVTGWYATLEVTGDGLTAVADDLAAQLTAAGLQTQTTGPGADGTITVRAEGVMGGRARHYDVQVIPASQLAPAQVQLIAASEPAP